MSRNSEPVFIRIVLTADRAATLQCPQQDLHHFARRPSAWVRAVCAWIAGCDGRLEASTDGKGYSVANLTSETVWPYYTFTAEPTTNKSELEVNIADIRKRSSQSASHSSTSRASSEADFKQTICERDGQQCIFTGRPTCDQAHIIPLRVQCKGRWNALSAARFGGIDINSAENSLSLDYGLRKTIDEDFRFAILPLGPLLSTADVHPQIENPPWPYNANDPDTTASTTLLLHHIPRAKTDEAPPASKKLKAENTEEELQKERELVEKRREREQMMDKYFSSLRLHNVRPRFREEALAPPKRELLEYRYAAMILKQYGTDDTKTMMDNDWIEPLGHIHKNRDQDEEDDYDEAGGNYGEGPERDGHDELNGHRGPVARDNSPPRAKQLRSRQTKARTNRSGLDQAFDVMYNITYHLHVAPMEAAAELISSRERAEKEAAIQRWVDGVSPDLHLQSSM